MLAMQGPLLSFCLIHDREAQTVTSAHNFVKVICCLLSYKETLIVQGDEDVLLPEDSQPDGDPNAEDETYEESSGDMDKASYPDTAPPPLSGQGTGLSVQPDDQHRAERSNLFAGEQAPTEEYAAAPSTPNQGAYEGEPAQQIPQSGSHVDTDVGYNDVGYEDESPERSPMGSPIRSPIRSPVRSPVRSPIRSPVRSPVSSPVRSRGGSPQGRQQDRTVAEAYPQLRTAPEQKTAAEAQVEHPERQKSSKALTCVLDRCL